MGHWYDTSGKPLHEIKGANGKMRATTLRDARKLALAPSYSTVVGDVLNKPGLLTWIKNEILEAVLINPVNPFADEEEVTRWKRKVLEESGKRTKAAAEHGTAIHDALEHCITEDIISTKKGLIDVIEPVMCFLKEKFPNAEWVTEKSFTHELGYGGCVDLHCPKTNIVLDFKTKMKPEEDIAKITAFDEHHMQTAAYTRGLGLPDTTKRYNLFVGYGIDKKGYYYYTGSKLTESKDFKREWGMFLKLLEFWQLKNKYVP
jgi:hypothetical protein